jgi:hypothetical protein
MSALPGKGARKLTLHPLPLVKGSIIVIGKWISERVVGVQQPSSMDAGGIIVQ